MCNRCTIIKTGNAERAKGMEKKEGNQAVGCSRFFWSVAKNLLELGKWIYIASTSL
jgi:hypothetical protein